MADHRGCDDHTRPSTKNQGKRRRDEPRNQWYFGMKAHIGVDAESKLSTGARAIVNERAGVEVAYDGMDITL